MNWPYELQIGWRYTRAGRAGRRNRFISFISGVSMLGIALGVAVIARVGREQREQSLEIGQGEIVQHVPASLRVVGGEGNEQVHAPIIRAAPRAPGRARSGSIAPA